MNTLFSIDKLGNEKIIGNYDLYPQNYDGHYQIYDPISKKFGFENHPAMKSGLVTPYWIVKVQNSTRKREIITSFKENGIDVRDWWNAGCHKQKAFKHLRCESMKNTDKLSSTTLGLPFHNFLKSGDFARISEVLDKGELE